MAVAKKPTKKVGAGRRWKMSWRGLLIAASVTLNIGFIVVFITMMTSNVLDGMFMSQGLSRYCQTANDPKFSDNAAYLQALRNYSCARGDAQQYFQDGFHKYLNFKHIAY